MSEESAARVMRPDRRTFNSRSPCVNGKANFSFCTILSSIFVFLRRKRRCSFCGTRGIAIYRNPTRRMNVRVASNHRHHGNGLEPHSPGHYRKIANIDNKTRCCTVVPSILYTWEASWSPSSLQVVLYGVEWKQRVLYCNMRRRASIFFFFQNNLERTAPCITMLCCSTFSTFALSTGNESEGFSISMRVWFWGSISYP